MCTVTVSASCKIIDMLKSVDVFVVPIIRTAGWLSKHWFNNICWLVNCTELKQKLVLKCVNVFVVAGLIELRGMACRSVFCYR